MDEWKQGAVVGAWVVDRYLRRGWTGSVLEVHRARDPSDLAVVKICDVPDAEMRQRFGREGSLLLKLSHPGIVPVRSAHFDHDPPYLVLEAVSGEDLGRLIERVGKLSVGQALTVAERVCDVLVHLHAHGRFHRDLKPSSVLLDAKKVLVTDFGIARESSRKGLTEPGTNLGSVEYAPPEWAKGKTDPQSWDLYALGVVLHEMLTGAPAFPSNGKDGSFDRALEVLTLKRQSPSLDPGPDLPDGVRALVRGLTATDPAERPATAKEVHERLVALLGAEGPVSLPPAPERQIAQRAPASAPRPESAKPAPAPAPKVAPQAAPAAQAAQAAKAPPPPPSPPKPASASAAATAVPVPSRPPLSVGSSLAPPVPSNDRTWMWVGIVVVILLVLTGLVTAGVLAIGVVGWALS